MGAQPINKIDTPLEQETETEDASSKPGLPSKGRQNLLLFFRIVFQCKAMYSKLENGGMVSTPTDSYSRLSLVFYFPLLDSL